MSNPTEVNNDTLISIIGIKEVELCVYREKVNALSRALQQAEAQLVKEAKNVTE